MLLLLLLILLVFILVLVSGCLRHVHLDHHLLLVLIIRSHVFNIISLLDRHLLLNVRVLLLDLLLLVVLLLDHTLKVTLVELAPLDLIQLVLGQVGE